MAFSDKPSLWLQMSCEELMNQPEMELLNDGTYEIKDPRFPVFLNGSSCVGEVVSEGNRIYFVPMAGYTPDQAWEYVKKWGKQDPKDSTKSTYYMTCSNVGLKREAVIGAISRVLKNATSGYDAQYDRYLHRMIFYKLLTF